MRIYFDTEFIEDGRTIDLLSIGLVREDGATYYAEPAEADRDRASDWVRENVLPHLTGPVKPRAVIAQEIVAFVQAIRKEDLFKAPGVAETLDWASALVELDAVALNPALVSDTLGVLLKYQDDIQKMQGSRAKDMLDRIQSALRTAE